MGIEAELMRVLADGTTVPWTLRDPEPGDDLPTDPVSDVVARARLSAIVAALTDTLAVGGTVSLSPETLAALEAVTATITGTPQVEDEVVRGRLLALLDLLEAGITVGLSAEALAALETVTAVVSGAVAVEGPVSLDAAALEALETVTAAQGGDWQVSLDVPVATEPTLLAVSEALGTLSETLALVLARVDGLEEALGSTTDTNAALTAIGRLKAIADRLPATALDVAAGRFYVSTSGRVQLTTAGNLRATVTNPANSGRSLVIQRIVAFATSTGYASLLVNPTTGLPGGDPRPRLNGIVGGGVAAVGGLRVDTNLTTPLSGGTDPGVTVPVVANQRTVIDLQGVVVVPPGVTLGINVPVVAAGDAVLSVYWSER